MMQDWERELLAALPPRQERPEGQPRRIMVAGRLSRRGVVLEHTYADHPVRVSHGVGVGSDGHTIGHEAAIARAFGVDR